MLEALLKRVDGLEKRLHTEKKSESSLDRDSASQDAGSDTNNNSATVVPRPMVDIAPNPNYTSSPTETR